MIIIRNNNYMNIFTRNDIYNKVKNILINFDENSKDINFKKGIYIYGSPGCGKTTFVMKVLNELNYDIIKYDSGDTRNKSLFETITSNNMSNRNFLQQLNNKKNNTKIVKKIAIVMDETEGMNSGDKGGITSLIKLIRQKKTKKQKMENITLNPIICIGNYFQDKKMKELMKVCHVFEIKKPTDEEISAMVCIPPNLKEKVMSYIQGDLRKMEFVKKILNKNPDMLNENLLNNILHMKSFNEDAKKTTRILLSSPNHIDNHNTFLNDTDRTTVALLWHENIIDAIENHPTEKSHLFYLKVLENMCFADYIDRITFQNQIWQFNEMSSLIKTFYNNKIYHECFSEEKKFQPTEIRFTKVLTKYSTEYNNLQFIYTMCQELDCDKKDLLSFFQEIRLFFNKDLQNNTESMSIIEKMFENYNITKLDIKRIYRYLDKNVKKDALIDFDDDSEDE